LGKEGYQIKATAKKVEVTAPTEAGAFYAVQTLLQQFPAIRTNALLQIPVMELKDQPRFAWRGIMLDVSRHFFGPELIKEFIDLLATYKLNRFHWHLADDPGWRIEIKRYPNLTQTGAWRVDQNHLPWGERPQPKPGEKPTYGGYYTQKQIREIVAYAAARNVTIVPEIEMPGHSAAAIASYPWLSCSQQPQLPMTGGNYTNMSSNYCPGNDSVYVFLQNVLTEVMDLFPSSYIHIGGDEVDKGSWKKCSKCQARMKANGLKTEEELQSFFITRMEKFINSKHRKMIGWDEILEGGLSPNATVMSWRGESGGIEAAKMDHDVVMTPGNPCYLDHYQAGPEGEPLAIGGMNTLKKVYDYEPIPKELNAQQAAHVLGAQGNLWTEFVTEAEHVEYMLLPRILALSEVLWSNSSAKDWNDFNSRLKTHFKTFDQKGLHYSKGNFKVSIKPVSNEGKLSASLFTEALDASIHYTTDGSLPGPSSPLYTAPLPILQSLSLRAVAVVNGKSNPLQISEQIFSLHKAVGRVVNYETPFSKYYPADGPNTLTDGVRGTTDHSKYWHGFNGNDLIATIDLGSVQEIRKLKIGCLQNYKSWIFLPTSVVFEGSSDGSNFEILSIVNNTIPVTEVAVVAKDFEAKLEGKKLRYVRVKAIALPAIPKGHPGEGKAAWTFADELIVE
jgi:hexosaminidase